MLRLMGVLAPFLHIESTDSMICQFLATQLSVYMITSTVWCTLSDSKDQRPHGRRLMSI